MQCTARTAIGNFLQLKTRRRSLYQSKQIFVSTVVITNYYHINENIQFVGQHVKILLLFLSLVSFCPPTILRVTSILASNVTKQGFLSNLSHKLEEILRIRRDISGNFYLYFFAGLTERRHSKPGRFI